MRWCRWWDLIKRFYTNQGWFILIYIVWVIDIISYTPLLSPTLRQTLLSNQKGNLRSIKTLYFYLWLLCIFWDCIWLPSRAPWLALCNRPLMSVSLGLRINIWLLMAPIITPAHSLLDTMDFMKFSRLIKAQFYYLCWFFFF